MSLELIKTTMEDIYENMQSGWDYDECTLHLAMREWTDCNFTHLCRHGRTEEHDNIECEVFDKMIVSYITGKARILQRWVRSFEELPMVCPCAEEV